MNSRSHSVVLQGEKKKKGNDVLTIIPLTELLGYLAVVRPPHDADLHFAPQRLEKLIQLRVDFLQIEKANSPQRGSAHVAWDGGELDLLALSLSWWYT